MKKKRAKEPMFARYLETPQLASVTGGAWTIEVSELGPQKIANSSTANSDLDYDTD